MQDTKQKMASRISGKQIPGMQNQDLQNYGHQNHDLQNRDLQNRDLQIQGSQNQDSQNRDTQYQGSQTTTTRKLTPRTRGKIGMVGAVALSAVTVVPLMGMKENNDSVDWANWDQQTKADQAKALAVNEGELQFLTETPVKLPPVLENNLTITRQSLKDGWVDMIQCHKRIDSVAKAQVLYHPRRTRNIKILSFENIQRAWVEDNSVQLDNIHKDASLCVQAQVKALYSNFNGSYSMRNGPFLRKFLDGYYPMEVTMNVTFPERSLSFEAITPQEQQGFKVHYDRNKMKVDALFVGELEIEVYFTDLSSQGRDG